MTATRLAPRRPQLERRASHSGLWRTVARATRRAAVSIATAWAKDLPVRNPGARTLADIGLNAGEVAFAAVARQGRHVQRSRTATQ